MFDPLKFWVQSIDEQRGPQGRMARKGATCLKTTRFYASPLQQHILRLKCSTGFF
jgi:hypothetical protein